MPEWDVCLFCLKGRQGAAATSEGMEQGQAVPAGRQSGQAWAAARRTTSASWTAPSPASTPGVSIDDNKFEIVDLGSKNGVLVNGKRTPRRFLRTATDHARHDRAEIRVHRRIGRGRGSRRLKPGLPAVRRRPAGVARRALGLGPVEPHGFAVVFMVLLAGENRSGGAARPVERVVPRSDAAAEAQGVVLHEPKQEQDSSTTASRQFRRGT